MKEFSWKNKRQSIVAILVLLVLWEIIAIKINNDIYLPRIEEVLLSMGEIFKDSNFLNNILSSLYRTVISFIGALLLAVILGVLSLMYPFFNNFLKPLNAIGKTIPTMVLVVLALIWFDKDKAPLVVGFAIVFPILYDGILSSLNGIDKKTIDMCSIYKVSTIQKVKKIYIPIIVFYIMNILISTFSLAFKVVVAGEVHGQPKYGIGSAIQIEKMNFNTTAIFGWILIIAIISVIFEWMNRLLLKKVYRWKNED
ncbi:ABC transporter permease [Clostridium paraputrificum]|uniref:ABC transporter permease n=1 Tax=Clostridium paraputrificum TaxID=29363 RepID=UPI003D32B725